MDHAHESAFNVVGAGRRRPPSREVYMLQRRTPGMKGVHTASHYRSSYAADSREHGHDSITQSDTILKPVRR